MSVPMNVLLIGVGGNISQGVLKALALCKLPLHIVVAGVDPLDFGLHTGYRAYVCPWAKDPAFMGWLVDTCTKEAIDAIVTGAEPVVNFLAAHHAEIEAATGAKLVVSSKRVVEICDDKLATCEWLVANGFACPAYAVSEDIAALEALAQQHGYPLIAKPRRDGGSRGLFVVKNDDDLRHAASRKNYIVQQCIGSADDEYTVGAYCNTEGDLRGLIALRRELHEGTSYRTFAGDYPDVERTAADIVQKLRPFGPCNIQCRVHKGSVYCFEINIRFSGTTPIRARFGFNDVEACLRNFVIGEDVRLPRITTGVAVRYINELYLDTGAVSALRTDGAIENPAAFSPTYEDFGIVP